jgi:hypothetical protein
LSLAEQRASELAVINSIQQGLAGQLDLQQVIDLVGDRLRAIFEADALRIDLVDRTRDLVTYPYVVDHGERFHPQPRAGIYAGISGAAMRERRTLVFDTAAELDAARRFGGRRAGHRSAEIRHARPGGGGGARDCGGRHRQLRTRERLR